MDRLTETALIFSGLFLIWDNSWLLEQMAGTKLGTEPTSEQLDSIMPWSATLPETCHRTYHQIVENMAEVK